MSRSVTPSSDDNGDGASSPIRLSQAMDPLRDGSDSSSEEENSDDDYEKTISSKRRRPVSGRSRTAKKSKASTLVEEDHEEEISNRIYDDLLNDAASVRDVVVEWLTKYEKDQQGSLVELVNFILKCCACNRTVNEFDVQDQESVSVTLSQIQLSVEKTTTREYPLNSKSPKFRNFRKKLSQFLTYFVSQLSSRKYLYDDSSIFEKIMSWIVAMSSSTMRPIRHTASVFCLIIMSSLCEESREFLSEHAIASKQLIKEEKRARPNNNRIQELSDSLQTITRQQDVISEYLNSYFDSVFVHRYRDVEPKIRIDCLKELGNWINIVPSVFFSGSYLRYLGWMLSDTNTTARLTVIKVLHKIFETESFFGGLRHFTSRFKERIIEISCVDAEATVRIASIRLCNTIRACGFLEDEEVMKLSQLILDVNPRIQREAIQFLCSTVQEATGEKIESWGDEEAISESFSEETVTSFDIIWVKYAQLSKTVEVLRDLFKNDPTDLKLFHVFQRNVSDSTPITQTLLNACRLDSDYQSWEKIASYILFDDYGSKSTDTVNDVLQFCKLSESQECILLQLLASSLLHISDSEFVVPKKIGKQQLEDRNELEKDDEKDLVYLRILPLLNNIIEREAASPMLLHHTLRLLFTLDFKQYAHMQLSKPFETLLLNLSKFFLTSNNANIIQDCTVVFLRMQSVPVLEERSSFRITEMCDQSVQEFFDLFLSFNLREGIITKDDHLRFEACLKRMEGCTSIKNITDNTQYKIIYDKLSDMLSRNPNALEDSLKFPALQSQQSLFFWLLLQEESLNGELIRSSGEKLFDCLILLINEDSSGVLKLQATRVLLEVIIMVSSFKATKGTESDEFIPGVERSKSKDMVRSLFSILQGWLTVYGKMINASPIKLVDQKTSWIPITMPTNPLNRQLLEQICCDLVGKLLLTGSLTNVLLNEDWEILQTIRGNFGSAIDMLFVEFRVDERV
ncbi:mitotic cohesin complex, STAG protein subunit Psc3 [Schizosaccharomyces osmophilus]|uniref:Mitotic cohesin complex, STAG protein subunit Psc3 n=1 Tax=Schizosaccharomyces osmophilus TaxID=2545709 RepID=A0AAE9WCD2_9SCHI|nr:mitotic cohesin complex, STAG protein subunit Psc3 [Schizosaccharomyces osmophilus]WBW73792.1 mitotic cohesin complex, STAG protein subunit Psc3 [Schizosaccharomyces osmophilus]